eukprot:c18521_g1_i2 orf=375-767(-)
MWSLMFQCIYIFRLQRWVHDFSIVVVPTPEKRYFYSYATVCLPVIDKVLINAIPASFSTFQVNFTQPNKPGKLGLLPVFNTQNYLTQYPSLSLISAYVFRNSMERGAYTASHLQFPVSASLKINPSSFLW